MNIALLGYGKMGKEIEAVAVARGHLIVVKGTSFNKHEVDETALKNADVVIEFSKPETVLENIHKCFDACIPVVVGTTGWHNHLEDVKKICLQKKQCLFYASNFSLGVNVFFKLNTFLAKIMNNFPAYDVSVEEIHHVHKLDKPSGTAISLANQILSEVERKNDWSIEKTENSTSLYIKDVREGDIPGTHIVKYYSAIDDIEIMHKAHNRKGFALGAVLAAEYSAGKTGVFTMENLLHL